MLIHLKFLLLFVSVVFQVTLSAHHYTGRIDSRSFGRLGMNIELLDGKYKEGMILLKKKLEKEEFSKVIRNIKVNIKIAEDVLDKKIKKETAHYLYYVVLIADPVQAAKDLTIAINLNPKYARSYIERASVYKEQNKSKLAIKDLLKAVEVDKNSYEAYYMLGVFAKLDNNPDKALQFMKQAVSINPNYSYPLNEIGLIYMYNYHDFGNALLYFKKAIKADPKDAIPYINMADFYFYKLKFKTGCKYLKKSCDISAEFCPDYHKFVGEGQCR